MPEIKCEEGSCRYYKDDVDVIDIPPRCPICGGKIVRCGEPENPSEVRSDNPSKWKNKPDEADSSDSDSVNEARSDSVDTVEMALYNESKGEFKSVPRGVEVKISQDSGIHQMTNIGAVLFDVSSYEGRATAVKIVSQEVKGVIPLDSDSVDITNLEQATLQSINIEVK
jgi:hypothetical protein